MANILLINPSWRQTYKNILSSFVLLFSSALSLATITTYAKKNSHRVSTTDISFRNFIPKIILSSAKKITQIYLSIDLLLLAGTVLLKAFISCHVGIAAIFSRGIMLIFLMKFI
jgi:hypothetical protein